MQARRNKKEALQYAKMEEAMRKARVCFIACFARSSIGALPVLQKVALVHCLFQGYTNLDPK